LVPDLEKISLQICFARGFEHFTEELVCIEFLTDFRNDKKFFNENPSMLERAKAKGASFFEIGESMICSF
jgi:hypothetical protein